MSRANAIRPLVAAVLLGALAAAGVRVVADHVPTPASLSPDMVIPYDGSLDVDGRPATGEYRLRFALYEGEELEVEAVWQDEYSVPVLSGAFTALLGSGDIDLPDDPSLFNSPIFIAVWIEDPDALDTWVPLVERERIVPVMASHLSSHALDLEVDEALHVRGPSAFETDVRAGFEGDNPARFYGETRPERLSSQGVYIDVDDVGTLDGSEAERPAWGLRVSGSHLELIDNRSASDQPVVVRFLRGDRVEINPDGATSIDVGTDGTTTIDGDLDVASLTVTAGGLRAKGGFTVLGDLGLTSAVLDVDDGIVVTGALNAGGQPLEVAVGDLEANQGLSVGGVATMYSNTDITGAITADGDAVIIMDTVDLGTDSTGSAGYPKSLYDCFIGGYSFYDGNMSEAVVGQLLKAYTERTDGAEWQLEANMVSEGNHEGHLLGVVCVHTYLTNRNSWF